MSALRAVMDPYLPLRALFDGPLQLSDGATVDFHPTSAVGGAAAAAARTLRPALGLDFEIGELPIVNYMSARDTGLDITAIPVFLTRRFVHGLSFKAANGPIEKVSDLNGKRIGVGYWGHTDTTWARGVLAEHGLDVDSVTWVTYNEEQVPDAVLPGNIVHIPRLNLDQMLLAGEIDAAIHHHGAAVEISDSALAPLIPDWREAEKAWFARTGVFPILHVVIIRKPALAAHPTLARELYAAFERAKQVSYDLLRSGAELSPADLASGLKSGFPVPELAYLGDDPMPYGLEANRANLTMLAEMATAQHVLSRMPSIDEIFEPCE